MRMPFSMGPIVRVSVGLIALLLCLAMAADFFLQVLPQRAESRLQVRHGIAENVAAQVAVALESGDAQWAGKSLQQVLARNRDALSVALRMNDGAVLAQRGDHARHWGTRESERTRWNHLQVPLNADGKAWGRLEIAFAPAEPRAPLDWLREPAVQFYLILLAGGFALCYVYLRRVMQYLDPSAAVPERVRAAFDTLADAILVLDGRGRIMLVNRAFRGLHPQAEGELTGRAVGELAWMPRHVSGASAGAPWDRALRGEKSAADEHMSIRQPDGTVIEVIVRCSLVHDLTGRARGCIVSFHDVTALKTANEQLRQTLGDLEQSREKIHAQNEELRRLAMRDPMTGCFNRRAFFDSAGAIVSDALRRESNLCVIMTDIDHFKGVNDVYGHSVGDQVIQVVARTLTGSIRVSDLLCRYGGEEFCILLPNTALADACAIAERARATIENGTSAAIRTVQVRKITSSFGVASLSDGAQTVQELIDQADQALYAAKEAGRNRVMVWVRDQQLVH
jgi:diguanylate cyclase (GGDEF)-like protein/PAS domain S-box-containing protein